MSLPHHLLGSRWVLEEYSRHRAYGVPYGDNRILCRLWGICPVFVDNRDYMHGARLVVDGYWEAWVTRAIARFVQPGFYCVDVGANYGYYTILMAIACGRDGRVLACEPNPVLARSYLLDNLAINGCREQVEICQKVIGDRDQEHVNFILHHGDYATSSLECWSHSHRTEMLRVPMTTLDQLCADWSRLDLVKVDVEGAEVLVWDGMQQTIARFPHAVVLIELHLQRDPPQAKSFLHQLERSGYTLRYINYEGDVTPIEASTIIDHPQEHWALWLQK